MLVKTDFGKKYNINSKYTDEDIMWFKLSSDMSDIHIMLYKHITKIFMQIHCISGVARGRAGGGSCSRAPPGGGGR